MVAVIIENSRYRYIHDVHKAPHAVDTHHIVSRRNAGKSFIVYLSSALLIAYAFFLFIQKDKPITVVIWSLLLGALLVKLLIWNQIEKESVLIMPAFGVQLETHFGSGRINRCFIPVSKILKPVVNECVTPVTCYWCLSFIVHGEEELILVFKRFRPPLKMLFPIWKALCAATESKENSNAFKEDGQCC